MILQKLQPIHFEMYEKIFEKGQKCKHVFLIKTGSVKNLE